MLSKTLNFAIAMVMVNALAGKVTDTYIDFAEVASSRLMTVISAAI